MEKVIWMYSLLCLPLVVSAFSVCETEGLLSEDLLDYIISSSSIPSIFNHTLKNLVTSRNAQWCTIGDLGSNPYFQLKFNSMVSITYMEAQGIPDGYVKQFRWEVQDECDNIKIYGNAREQMLFTASGPERETFTFGTPIQGKTFRIYIVDVMQQSMYLCWNIRLYGCIANPMCDTETLLNEELLDTIIGSSSIPNLFNNTIKNLVTSRNTGWCTVGDLGNEPYFQLIFNSMVCLTSMETRGIPNGYVSQFRLEVQDECGNFNVYGNTSDPMLFTTSSESMERFTFWQPLQGRIFRLYIVDVMHQSTHLCWNIRLYGCITNTSLPPPTVPMISTKPNTEASPYTTQETPPTEEVTGTSSYTTQETVPTEEVSETSSYTIQKATLGSPQGQHRGAIVGGAVVGVLSLLVALLLLLMMVAAIFILRKRSPQIQLAESFEDAAEHKFDNPIYGMERTLPTPYKDIPDHSIYNSLYGGGGETNEENHPDRTKIVSSIISNTYESIPNTTIEFHEPTHDVNGTVGHNESEAYGNPLYDENLS